MSQPRALKIRFLVNDSSPTPAGALSWAVSSAASDSEAIAWLPLHEAVLPGFLEGRLAELPTHAIGLGEGGLCAAPIRRGIRGFLQIAGLLDALPPDSALAYLPDGFAVAADPARTSEGLHRAHPGLLAAANRRAFCARIALWVFCAGALLGGAFGSYFALWALRRLPDVRWNLLSAVLVVQGVQWLMLAASAAWLLRRGGARVLELAESWVFRMLRERGERLADTLEADVPAGTSVLDVGAADGRLLSALQSRRGIVAQGVDAFPMSTADVPVRACPDDRFPFPDRSFDVALAVVTLHHCADPDRVLREIRRVTSGRLLLVEDCCDSPWQRMWMYLLHLGMRGVLGMPWNQSAFGSEARWRARLNGAGFEVVECRRIPIPTCQGHSSSGYLFVAVPR